jgi:hypothetical protein
VTTTSTLQDRLTALVLADPDVQTLYSTRPALVEIATQTVGAILPVAAPSPEISVSETDAGTSVTASVGVTGEHSATGVCRNLHDSIARELTAAGAALPLTIAVKIASIASER